MKIFHHFDIQNETIIVSFFEKTNVHKRSTTTNFCIVNYVKIEKIFFVEIVKKFVEKIEIDSNSNLNSKIIIKNRNRNFDSILNFDFDFENIDLNFISKINIIKKNAIIKNSNFIDVFSIFASNS